MPVTPEDVKKHEAKKTELTMEQLQNLIAIVSTHPTPEGVGSPNGQYKINLVNVLSKMVDELKK